MPLNRSGQIPKHLLQGMQASALMGWSNSKHYPLFLLQKLQFLLHQSDQRNSLSTAKKTKNYFYYIQCCKISCNSHLGHFHELFTDHNIIFVWPSLFVNKSVQPKHMAAFFSKQFAFFCVFHEIFYMSLWL